VKIFADFRRIEITNQLKKCLLWIAMLFLIWVTINCSLEKAFADYTLYDDFNDDSINTDLWGFSGPVQEREGKIILGTEGMIWIQKNNIIGMSFSVTGYQNIGIGDHVNIHLATRTPTNDLVIVGEAIHIYPADNPDDPPGVNNYIICQWYEDGIIDLEHLHHVNLQPAQWGVPYIFGLEYSPEGSILVKVNEDVVYSFSVPGADVAYSQGGAQFWFRADNVEPWGGDVTAEIDWAEAKISYVDNIDEFRVNQFTDFIDEGAEDPAIATDSNNHFIITWEDPRYGRDNVFARIFDGDGNPLCNEFRVDQDPDVASDPSIAVDKNNHFIITWEETRLTQVPENDDIFARMFDSEGTPLTDEFRVDNDIGTNEAVEPVIATNNNNRFMIAWTDFRSGHSDIFAKNFAGLLADINKDGVVDISDVIFVLRCALELTIEPYCPCSDINEDGVIDISDVILTLRMALGIDPLKPCTGEPI
jgi:hypothetical protein